MTQEFDQSIRDARLVARYLGRRIGDYHYRYRNEKLLIAVDSSNVSVKLMTSTRTLVLEWTGDVTPSNEFHAGRWCDYLHQLADKAEGARMDEEADEERLREETRARRYAPVDDSAMFPEAVTA